MNIASIDLGTNTVLLLIAIIEDGKLIPLLNEYRMPRLGKGLKENQPINNDRIEELFKVLHEYSWIIKQYNCEQVLAVGTNAFRIANNSDDIIIEVKKRYGIDIKVIPGEEEARLSFIGAASSSTSENKVVIDIGGGSTEIIYGSNDEIKYSKSFHTGVVSLTEKYLHNNPPTYEELKTLKSELRNIFAEVKSLFNEEKDIISVAGTPTSLSCIKQGLRDYIEEKVEGSTLTQQDLEHRIEMFSKMKSNEILTSYPKIVAGREDIIFAGTLILLNLLQLMDSDETIVSARGLRYGVILDYIKNNLQGLR